MEVKKVFQVGAENTGTFLKQPGLGLYIPAYQRPYSWATGNIDRLVQDLVDGVIRSESNPDAMTFLGALIQVVDPRPASVHPKVQGDLPKGVTLLIDGQQRLTTILVLNTCLRESIKKARSALPKDLPEEAKKWFERMSLRMEQGLLDSLQFTMPGGDEGFDLYPRMIRAHVDTWSSSKQSAQYQSPIAHLLHGYAVHAAADDSERRRFKFKFDAGRKNKHKEFYKAVSRIRRLLKDIKAGEGGRLDELPEFKEAIKSDSVRQLLLGDECPNPDEKTDGLARLLVVGNYLQDRVCVTSVSVTEEDYAFDMFEALNTTGEPLTAYETLRPRIIEAEGLEHYGSSSVKEHVDAIDGYFRSKSQSARRKDTGRIITFFALAESGEKRGRKLSEQRQYLRKSFPVDGQEADRVKYVAHMRYLTDFVDQLWEPSDASLAWKYPVFDTDPHAALAMRAISAANHEITIAPLVRWFAHWRTSGEGREQARAFCDVLKGLTAFFAIWRLSHASTANVDRVVRTLMREGHEDPRLKGIARTVSGGGLPSADQVLSVLRDLLGEEQITDEQSFTRRMIQTPAYERSRAHTRLLLLMASHDAVPDSAAPGLLKKGTVGVNPMLSRDRWQLTAETVEHIAPTSRKKPDGWDDAIYDTEGARHRLGNLTILPVGLNSALGNRDWPHKRHIYGLLTAKTQEDAAELRREATKAGLELPERWQKEHPYQAQVEALSRVDDWTLDLIERRSTRMCELAWGTLREWLRWPG